MNDNNPSQFLQQGFRIAIGAVTSLVETAQNPEKRAEVISELQMELNQKTREWAVKGENTEQEARRVIDNLWRQRNAANSAGNSQSSNYSSNESNINSGLQQLKDDIVALRTELSKMRESQE